MRKILSALAIGTVLLASSAANAQHYQRGYGYGGGYHYGGGGGWVAPFVGGAIIGGVLGGALAAPPPVVYAPAPAPVYVQPTCWDELYYDSWNRPYYRRVCR
jgi:hypothetical protein